MKPRQIGDAVAGRRGAIWMTGMGLLFCVSDLFATDLRVSLVPNSRATQATGVVEGKVIQAESGRRLKNAKLTFVGTDLSTKTGDSGSYQIEGVPAGEINVRVELTGYATAVEPVVVTSGNLTIADFRLVPLATILDEVFVDARPYASGTVVEIGASEMASMMQTLDGSVAGAVVYRAGGNLGSGTNIVIRGLKSFTLRNDPLIFLDGIRMTEPNTTIRGGRGLTVLELLGPEQIDRIEVLTGPEATTRYGLGAVNGVILIYSKR